MTPEQRALALFVEISRIGRIVRAGGPVEAQVVAAIAAAIRQAENDAYERAAELALDGVMVDVLGTTSEPPTKAWHGPTGFDLAEQIRTLKSQKD